MERAYEKHVWMLFWPGVDPGSYVQGIIKNHISKLLREERGRER